MEAVLIADADALAALVPVWDALAVLLRRPMSSPAWMIGQWRHLRPPGALLRVVAVWERGELVAVAPFYAERKRAARIDLRLLGGSMPRAGPLALPGRAWEAAGPIAATLDAARPRADVLALESGPLASAWPDAFAAHWPGRLRPPTHRYYVQASHCVSLRAPSFDDWLAGKGAHFRNRMRALRRRFERAGGNVRASTAPTLHEDIETFLHLHSSRWEGRGESPIVAQRDDWGALLEEMGRVQLGSGRLRLYVLELDGEPVAARVCAAAGGEVIAVNGGWDERHAKLGVANLGMLYAIEDAFTRGDARFDLGPGDQDFKRRFADGNDPVAWTMLVVPRPRMALTLARVTPMLAGIRARDALKRALPPEQLGRARALRTRGLGPLSTRARARSCAAASTTRRRGA